MKVKRIALIVLLLLLAPRPIYAEQITLLWDYDNSAAVDGFRVFYTIPHQDDTGQWHTTYDYALPLTTTLYQDGNVPPELRELTIDLPGRANLVTSYRIVARAFRDDQESADSNQLSYKVVRVPPEAPIELLGSYDTEASVVTLEWQQPPDDWDISRWVVYYRTDGGFTELGVVDGDRELKIAEPLNLVLPGEQNTVAFSVVAFRRSGVFSANSSEFEIHIDRREIPPMQNLRIRIEIPL